MQGHAALTACLYYRSNCTESICFDSIRLQEYVYTTPVALNQISSIRGTAFTRVVRITQLLVWSSSIRFKYHSPRWYDRNRSSLIRFKLHYEWNQTSSNLRTAVNGLLEIPRCIKKKWFSGAKGQGACMWVMHYSQCNREQGHACSVTYMYFLCIC